MASNNETLADIVEEMVEFGNHCAAFGGAYSPERWNNLCKRLIAAHKQEIAAKDAEIAELRERIKVAEYALKVRNALSAPPRNCDRPECATTKEAQDVWRQEDGGKTAYYEWLLAKSTKGETV